MKYRQKPVVIDAILYTGKNFKELSEFCEYSKCDGPINYWPGVADMEIRSLTGRQIASIGDYIIRGVKGEYYPCKPDIFQMTFESAAAGGEVPTALTEEQIFSFLYNNAGGIFLDKEQYLENVAFILFEKFDLKPKAI